MTRVTAIPPRVESSETALLGNKHAWHGSFAAEHLLLALRRRYPIGTMAAMPGEHHVWRETPQRGWHASRAAPGNAETRRIRHHVSRCQERDEWIIL